MSTTARSDSNVVKAAGEFAAANYVNAYSQGLLGDKTRINAGYGAINVQIPESNDPGFPLQSSFLIPSDAGGVPNVVSADESANAGEGLLAVPLSASSDTSADPVHPTLDPFEALLTEASTASGSVIGTQIQDFS